MVGSKPQPFPSPCCVQLQEKGCDPGGVWGHEESIHVQLGLGSGNQQCFPQSSRSWGAGLVVATRCQCGQRIGFCFQSGLPASTDVFLGQAGPAGSRAREALPGRGAHLQIHRMRRHFGGRAEEPMLAGATNEYGKRVVLGQLAL